MERISYNAALGMLPLNEFGKAFYQSDYARSARKRYFDGYNHIIGRSVLRGMMRNEGEGFENSVYATDLVREAV